MRRTVAGIVGAAVVAGSCGTSPPDHVRIGVLAPVTGERAYLGGEVATGVGFAVEDLNAGGGLLGAEVEAVVVDDAELLTLPGRLADLAERARVTAIVGPEAPGVLLGPRSPLTRRSVPAVLPTAFTGDLDGAATTVVRTVPSATAQAAALGRWLREVRLATAIAVLVVDPVEGSAARPELRSALESAGLAVVDQVAEADAISLRPAVASLRARAPGADALLIWGPPPQAARGTLAARGVGWDVQVAVPATSFVAEYRTLAGSASEGVVLAFPFDPAWFGAEVTTWMVRYHLSNGLDTLPQLDTLVLDIPVVAIAAYDAVGLIAAAVRRAGTREPGAVAAALREVRHEGLLRDYAPSDPEVWDADELFVARFLGLGVIYDADPRLDPDEQRRFWEQQVAADYLPDAVLRGPAGDVLRRLIASRSDAVPTYEPVLPPPGPVGRPGGAS